MNLPKFGQIARVIERSDDGITFEVDPVEKRPRNLLTEGAYKHFAKHNERRFLACSHKDSLEVVRENDVHPLAGAVHLAFSEHRPLRLTPDHIWLTIAQGFAHHVNNNAETLRSRLVGFQDKMVLQVPTFGLEGPEDWAGVINEWAEDIGDFIPGELSQTLLCDFTTTTPAARIASQIVMMDAFQRFFDYRVYCVCGIPSITLSGTVEDWRRILSRVEHLSRYDLRWWTDRLLPICEAFAQTAEGKPSREFWRCIYKPEGIYGEQVITGWLADLFPYILGSHHTEASSPTVKNPVLSVPRRELTVDHGITPSSLPRGLSRVPFTLETKKAETRLELMAGFIGVKLDRRKDERLEPEIGWGVREAEKLPELLAEIKHEHPTQAAFVGPDPADCRQWHLRKRCVARLLHHRNGGGAAQRPQARCPIGKRAGQHDPDRPMAATHRGRPHHGVDCRTGVVLARSPPQQRTLAIDEQMLARRRDIDAPFLQGFVVLREGRRQRSLPGQYVVQ